MKVVVDANVVIAALLRDGITRKAFFLEHELVAPALLLDELQSNMPIVIRRASAYAALATVVESILERIELFDADDYARHLQEAVERVKAAHADGDEAYVALAMLLDAPVWTHDDDFGRIKGIRTVTTAQLSGQMP